VSEKFDLVYHEAYCFITWMPENIPAFIKARVSTHQVCLVEKFVLALLRSVRSTVSLRVDGS